MNPADRESTARPVAQEAAPRARSGKRRLEGSPTADRQKARAMHRGERGPVPISRWTSNTRTMPAPSSRDGDLRLVRKLALVALGLVVTFKATWRPSSQSTASYTAAAPPRPTSRRRSNGASGSRATIVAPEVTGLCSRSKPSRLRHRRCRSRAPGWSRSRSRTRSTSASAAGDCRVARRDRRARRARVTTWPWRGRASRPRVHRDRGAFRAERQEEGIGKLTDLGRARELLDGTGFVRGRAQGREGFRCLVVGRSTG